MPEEKKLTVLQQFIKDRPIPEDNILKYFSGEKKENALGFVVWLRENKLSPRFSRSSPNSWEIDYKSKCICNLVIAYSSKSRDDWRIDLKLTHLDVFSEKIMSENLQEIIWNGTSYCRYGERSPYFGMAKAPGCNPKKPCKFGKTITVLGKEFTQCCIHADGRSVSFTNPDDVTLEGIKKLLELEKQARDD